MPESRDDLLDHIRDLRERFEEAAPPRASSAEQLFFERHLMDAVGVEHEP